MNFIIIKMLKVLGPLKLARMVWKAVRPELERLAKKTNTQLDEQAILLVDELLNSDYSKSDLQA